MSTACNGEQQRSRSLRTSRSVSNKSSWPSVCPCALRAASAGAASGVGAAMCVPSLFLHLTLCLDPSLAGWPLLVCCRGRPARVPTGNPGDDCEQHLPGSLHCPTFPLRLFRRLQTPRPPPPLSPPSSRCLPCTPSLIRHEQGVPWQKPRVADVLPSLLAPRWRAPHADCVSGVDARIPGSIGRRGEAVAERH